MVELNADLALPRHTVFYLYFPNPESAFAAAEELRQMQYEAETAPQSSIGSSNSWPVIAEKVCIVNEEAVEAERELLDAIAERFGGEFDGWEAALD